MTSSDVDWKPKIGMGFDSMEEANKFWLAYSFRVGFGVRVRFANKKEDGSVSSCRLVCCKEGLKRKEKRYAYEGKYTRADVRTNCPVRITLSRKNGKLVINDFEEEHNHDLQNSETKHMLRSHRKITEVQAYEIDLANDSGLRQKSTFQLLSTQAGHRANVGFTEVDVRNYITARRKRSMAYGEIGCLSKYFQRQLLENPSFFHAYQMDVEEHITNVFWCDAQMILDYGYFGDVVSLDTTYCTNYANRPLAFFSGFNHYRGSVIFGAALMYDETSESFRWLFDTFLQAHNNKKPKTIFTDQDQAMARAVADVMPETHHGLCTWHLLQNGVKHLGNMMKGGSSLLSDIKKCMYDIDIEADFEKLWFDMIHKFNIHDKSWIISTYELKKKWASCYMKGVLTLGMRSTQVSESLNAHFKSCMKPNVNILEFFNHFEIVVEEKRAKELSCVYESSHKLARLAYETAPILIQMGKTYTHTVFELFQDEFKLFLTLSVPIRHESDSLCEYVITKAKHEGSWRVSFNRVSNSITCSCRKFDTFGILCSHALKVFELNDVKVIPDNYILKRWTREARFGVVQDFRGKEVEGDPNLSRNRMFR
ncbi:putative transcription factor FAR family [Medicago truncatula]|uniref:Putative transcription factor FAR family n=1 Tax=Medicago truncatula TaxID=3880 RepID=A0A396JHA3_MEDTR|nr:protein FAR1-RELATED SEQUENCE 5-like [Medicago truncatula]RHN75693.1 putative transcription factor FAR family [Medicago truncatula]